MITILVNLALLPAQINSFISILSERRDIGMKFHRLFTEFSGQKSYAGKSHVVLFAHEPNSIIPFMREFFHLDREEAQSARVFSRLCSG